MTRSIFSTLQKMSEETLMRVWGELNKWQWPTELKRFEPNWWKWGPEREVQDRKLGAIYVINNYIEGIIPQRKIIRWLNEQEEKQ